MIQRDKIPLRSRYYWAKVFTGHKDETELQPVELMWTKDEPRIYIIGYEPEATSVISEFVAPIDPPRNQK